MSAGAVTVVFPMGFVCGDNYDYNQVVFFFLCHHYLHEEIVFLISFNNLAILFYF